MLCVFCDVLSLNVCVVILTVVGEKPAEGNAEGSQINVVSNRTRPPPPLIQHPSQPFIQHQHQQQHPHHLPHPPHQHPEPHPPPSTGGPIIHHEVKPPLGRPRRNLPSDAETASENPNSTVHSHYSEAASSQRHAESMASSAGHDSNIRPPGQDTPPPDLGMMMPPVHQHPPMM